MHRVVLFSWVFVLACAALANGTVAFANGASEPHHSRPAKKTIALSFGTYLRPFAADSPWNRIPVKPVFDSYVLPKTPYFPFVGTGAYTSGTFLAKPNDAPMTVHGLNKREGVWHTDQGQHIPITLPHWPHDVLPAEGADGHADIIDPASNRVHSFWQLRKIDGQWRATQYSWSALNGRGWSDPANNHQGARAAGVPTTGGLIRKHELDDGDIMFRHVLALTLDGNAMKRGYVYPATAEDDNSPVRYKGEIPMGSLLMLPGDFDTAQIKTPALRKVAQTLKYYGGAVVDINDDTRFAIPVELGADFELHRNGWNSQAGNELTLIADHLRRVVSVERWLDGHGKPTVEAPNFNLLSMRGPWELSAGTARIRFDSWQQALVFEAPEGGQTTIVRQDSKAHRRTTWAPWQTAARYRFSVSAHGGARLKLQFRQADGSIIWESPMLGDKQNVEFVMPDNTDRPTLVASSGKQTNAWVRGELVASPSLPNAQCDNKHAPCVRPISLRKHPS